MSLHAVAVVAVLGLLAAACSASADGGSARGATTAAEGAAEAPSPPTAAFPPPPPVPDGPVDDDLAAVLARYSTAPLVPDLDAITSIGASGDARALWVLSDILRFTGDQATYDTATDAASSCRAWTSVPSTTTAGAR